MSLSARDTKGAPRETTLKRNRRRMDTYKEAIITSAQNIIGEKQNETNEE